MPTTARPVAAVGHSELHDTAAAVRQALDTARARLPDAATPALALVFSTSRHNPHLLSATLAAELPTTTTICGGYAVGTITHDHLAYDGWQLAIALLTGPLPHTLVTAENLPGREREVGAELRRALTQLHTDDALLLFYDTVKTLPNGTALNMATPLLKGLADAGPLPPRLAGMGMIGDMQLHPTFQFAGRRVMQAAALALHLPAPVQLDTVILHGCKPAGRYHTITAVDNHIVLEIDGRPALDVIAELLGPDAALAWDDYAFFVTLGVNRGEEFGPFREDDYANRLCIGIDRDRKGLVMFENDLTPGTRVQLMRRSIDLGYIPSRVELLLKRAAGRTPLLCLYIDCAGRAAAYCGMDEEEADAVRNALPRSVPLLGVYSGVEIAPLGIPPRPQALDWTGVLCLLSI